MIGANVSVFAEIRKTKREAGTRQLGRRDEAGPSFGRRELMDRAFVNHRVKAAVRSQHE